MHGRHRRNSTARDFARTGHPRRCRHGPRGDLGQSALRVRPPESTQSACRVCRPAPAVHHARGLGPDRSPGAALGSARLRASSTSPSSSAIDPRPRIDSAWPSPCGRARSPRPYGLGVGAARRQRTGDADGLAGRGATWIPPGEVRGAVVLDNLIHRGDLPVTIGVLVDPGVLAGAEIPEAGGTAAKRRVRRLRRPLRHLPPRGDHPRGHPALVDHRRPRSLGPLRLQQRRQHARSARRGRAPTPADMSSAACPASRRCATATRPGAHARGPQKFRFDPLQVRPPTCAGRASAATASPRTSRRGGVAAPLRLPPRPRRRRAQPEPRWRPAARRPSLGVQLDAKRCP